MPFVAIGCVVILALFVVIAGMMMFMAPQSPAQQSGATGTVIETSCGTAVDTLIPGYTMVPSEGKIGHEQHLTDVKSPGHYDGINSNTDKVGFAGGGAFAPHTQDQEHWYFNSQWGGWNWGPTRYRKAPIPIHTKKARKARELIPHSKLIITSVETGKSVIVSAEESGPALWVTDRDGINNGAPPEVYKALGVSGSYTGTPKDNHGRVKIKFVAPGEQDSAKLGPCK